MHHAGGAGTCLLSHEVRFGPAPHPSQCSVYERKDVGWHSVSVNQIGNKASQNILLARQAA